MSDSNIEKGPVRKFFDVVGSLLFFGIIWYVSQFTGGC